MRVLLTTDTIGGVWTYTKELTEGLLDRSHAVSLVSFGRLPEPDQDAWCTQITARFPDRFEYTPTSVPLEWMDPNTAAYTGAEDIMLHAIRRFEPDLLHTSQFCFGKLDLPIPKLVVAHSDVLSWAAVCRPHGLETSPWLETYKRLVQDGLSGAAALVAPTRSMLHALSDHFSLPRETCVIPNGRDLTPAASQTPRSLQAVTLGRVWDEAKGLDSLSEISSPLPILVAGETRHGAHTAPSALGDALLLGRLSEESLFHLLRSSSIYLALSRYEPFGLAPLEAALCGCAIVARDIPSFREVWGSAALFFDDTPSLQHRLDRLTSDPQLLAEYQGRSLKRARQLNRSRMTELYLDLYRHLLDPETYPVQLPFREVRALVS